MKKTHNNQQPQYLRERNLSAPDRKTESMNLGTVSGKALRARKRRTKRIQQFAALGAVVLVTISIILIINHNKAPKGNPSSSVTSSASGVSAAGSSAALSASGQTTTEQASSPASTLSSTTASASTSGTVTQAERASAFLALQDSVTSYAGNFNGRIGIYYINLKTGETWGLNEKEPFVAASSIKMGINTLLYKKVAEGAFKFTDMLAYDNRAYPTGDMEPGTGSIIGQPNGTKFSVRRTSQLSITISDNCATNMVIRKLGGIDTVVPYLTSISGEVPYRTPVSYTDYKGAIVSGRHRISAKDLAKYAQNLYTLWQASKEDYQPLIDDLENTVFEFGVQSKLPKTVKVAHKIGTNGDYRTENDVGIVFAKEPYVICVTTENSSQSAGRTAVADISLQFYNFIAEVTK